MNEKIKQLSQGDDPWPWEQRRYLHKPEASAMEHETSRYLRQVLEELVEVEGGHSTAWVTIWERVVHNGMR